jgi:prepilin-type N-terminal cleavage/methylation domain-containing protein
MSTAGAQHAGRFGRSGFSLVEVLVVVIILGILAAAAVPTVAGASRANRTEATASIVAQTRSAIAAFRERSVVGGGSSFPTLGELTTAGVVLDGAIPPNPFTGVSGVSSASAAHADARTVSAPTASGWRYFVDNTAGLARAAFYANTDTATDQRSPSTGLAIGANQL